MCYKELELETGKYYDVISSSDNNEYKRLKLIEFNYTGIDSILYFVNNEGRKITFEYCDILDIVESKEKVERYPESLYFKDKLINFKVDKYWIKTRIQKNFCLAYNDCIIDGVEWSDEVPHLRIITQNNQTGYINMTDIEDII